VAPVGGEHFLQTPGPSNVPGRVLRAISRPTIDHRGPEFAGLTKRILDRLPAVFGTSSPVVLYPASGTGAWQAALVNTLSPGDRVLAFETGHFARLWSGLAERLGLVVDLVPGDWRHGVEARDVEERLRADRNRQIAAVLIVHNETSTSVCSDIEAVRAAMDAADHPALLLVDAVSSLASMAVEHDRWRVDVTVSSSQKGLMLPPGLGLTAVSEKAVAAAKRSTSSRGYWDWEPVLSANAAGMFPYTPPTNLLFGLDEALDMLEEEGLPAVFARHQRHAAATRAAVEAWGLELVCVDPSAYSASVTAVMLPGSSDGDRVCAISRDRFNMSLGIGLGRLAGPVFRVGHLGHFGDLALIGTLGGVELALRAAGVEVSGDGVRAALDMLA
jgi:alanine-glyoxylate transaminase/serine-glyoxylate transaminase/serine-pyruvate transaminase